MKAVKEAIRAKAIGDSTLTTLLGGQHVFQASPETLASALTAWVTFRGVSAVRDEVTGMISEVYQFDAWATTSDVADAVAERIEALFAWDPTSGGGGLTITGRRLVEPVYSVGGPGDMVEQTPTDQLHHKVRQFRVVSI